MRRHLAGLMTTCLAVILVPALSPPAAAAVQPPARAAAGSVPVVGELRTNALVDPLGIATTAPTLGWQLESERRGVTQKAYQVRVASSEKKLSSPDAWDSRKVKSKQSVDITYAGRALKPRTDYVWSVRVWDDKGRASAWSEPATFGTGLGDQPWTADWIGAETPELGAEWTDYTIAFTASDIKGALGVYFRGQDTENAYMWQLSESDDALRPHVKRDGAYSVLAPKSVPDGFDFAAEHDYAITVEGDTITTTVDGQQLDQRTDASFPGPGVMGFRTNGAESGLVQDVTVTSASDEVLVDTDFPDGDHTFTAGTITADGLRVDGAGEAWLRGDDALPLLRKEADLGEKTISRARIYAAARGVYELRLNGERVGDTELAPGWTAYDKRIDYQTYDVTDQVSSGENVLGAEVAPGWYSGKVAMFGTDVYGAENSVIAELVVDYSDGTSEVIRTDDTWRTSGGPTREADLLDGEWYDAGRAAEVDGWDEAAYDDEDWAAVAVRDEPTDVLEPQTTVDVRVTDELETAERIDSPTDGVYLYDLGQNMVGHVRITLQGKKGQTVKIRHGEVLNPDGTLYTDNLRTAKATDTYTFGSDEPETYEPSFTFHGFRYVEVSGVDEAPDAADIVGVVVGTDGDLTSKLDTSSELVDQLQSNIVWGMRGNFLSIPTDTPARDERMGWTGDINVFARTAVYNMDSESFLTKWMQDLRDTQRPNGSLPGVAPIVPGRFDGGYESAGWMDAGVHVPWTLWQAYGETGVITENYEMMKRYVDFLDADSTGHIRSAGGYLDWLNLDDPTPADVLDTAFVAKSTREFAQMAKAIGRDGDAAAYQARYEAIRAAYQQAFIGADGSVKGDSQTAYILTLTNDLEPADRREAVYDQFVQTLERRDYHLSTGFLGVDGLLPALTKAGRTDIAYQLLQHQDYPSWGYEIGKGATTIWERWNSINPDGSFNDVGMNSFNHYAYGAVGEWMYRTMAGVSAAEPGYRKVRIAPEPGDGVDNVDYSLETPYGTVRSSWATDDGPMTLDITVPANTTAEVRIPAANRWAVTEGGSPIEDSKDIDFVRQDEDVVVLEVGSGSYSFAVAPALGDVGAARAEAAATAADVSALRLKGVGGKAAKRDLEKRTEKLRDEIDEAWELAGGDAGEEDAAEAVHLGLAAAARLDRAVQMYADSGVLAKATAAGLRDRLTAIEKSLSSASARLVGAVSTLQVPTEEVLPGDAVEVSVRVENTGKKPLSEVTSSIDVPNGWTASPVGAPADEVPAGGHVEHSYDVKVPEDAEVGPVDLTGEVSYSRSGGAATLPVGGTLMVGSPVEISATSSTPESVDGGQTATVTALLHNRSKVTQSGELSLTGPAGWSADPVDYEIPAGQDVDVAIEVVVPQTVVAGQTSLTVATGAAPTEQAAATVTVGLPAPPSESTAHVDLGDATSETAHGLTASERSATSQEAGLTRRYTHSSFPEGWFEFDAEVPTDRSFVVRIVETFDGARRKTYDVALDGAVAHSVDLSRTGSGEGTMTHQFLVEPSALTADGSVRIRFQDTGAEYDPSVADVWVVPAQP